jgi:hypothetical protein
MLDRYFYTEIYRTISRSIRTISRILKLSIDIPQKQVFTGFRALFHKNAAEQFIAGTSLKAAYRAGFRERKNIKYI